MTESAYIPLDECIDRTLYEINSRNLDIGIFDKETNGFIGLRYKFHPPKFLFTEIHWDADPTHGTVKPLRAICLVPDSLVLDNTDAQYRYLEVYVYLLEKENYFYQGQANDRQYQLWAAQEKINELEKKLAE